MRDPRSFSPLPWQLKPWVDTSPVMLLHSGAGTGKSELCAHKINALLMRFPNALGLWVRKSRSSLRNSSLPALEAVLPPQVQHIKSEFRFEYPNGSRLVYGGMYDDKQREALRSLAGKGGSGADFVVMEEGSAFTKLDFEELRGRMRGNAAGWRQIMIPTNPAHDRHWINQTLIRPNLTGKPLIPGVSVYHPKPEDNPFLDAAYLEALRSLTGVMRMRLYEGLWVRAEGVVYESWDPEKHIVEPFEIPREWRRIRVTDFGYVNPRVVLWIAIDPDDCMYVYRQTYQSKQKASDSAREVIRLSASERFEATICDHDADERAEFEDAGIPTLAANKQVSRGIQLTDKRLQEGRIKFLRGCLVREDEELRRAFKPCSTEEEFEVYVWAKNSDGSVSKEEPEKKNDHGLDALRYGVMYVDRDLCDPAGNDLDAIERDVAAARAELKRHDRPLSPSRDIDYGDVPPEWGGKGSGSSWL